MKPKTKAFLDEIISNPAISTTEAYLRTHETDNRRSASASASQLLTKPNVQQYLDEHVVLARNTVLELIGSSVKPEIRLRAAQDILDRSLGKASQSINVSTKTVMFSIDLSSNDAPGVTV